MQNHCAYQAKINRPSVTEVVSESKNKFKFISDMKQQPTLNLVLSLHIFDSFCISTQHQFSADWHIAL